ncbi:MAG: hypothetical protein KY450_00495 [Actinobacteria bacterium]|nr:hypothetical protein [Actinomycetota bacterium]
MSLVAAVELSRGIEEAWANVAAFFPKFVAFLLILVVGIFIAKALAKAADKILERVGFDQAVERGGVKQALSKSQYDASDIVGKIIYYALVLFVLQFAFGVFGPNPVSDLITGVIGFLPRVFAAIVIVVVGAAIAAAVKELLEAALGGLSYGKALAVSASVAILTVAGFAALSQLRIAPAIVNGLFYALLAIVVGSAVIAIGGGGIQPMRSKWEQALGKLEEESQAVRRESAGAGERIQGRMEQRTSQLSTSEGTSERPLRAQ